MYLYLQLASQAGAQTPEEQGQMALTGVTANTSGHELEVREPFLKVPGKVFALTSGQMLHLSTNG